MSQRKIEEIQKKERSFLKKDGRNQKTRQKEISKDAALLKKEVFLKKMGEIKKHGQKKDVKKRQIAFFAWEGTGTTHVRPGVPPFFEGPCS